MVVISVTCVNKQYCTRIPHYITEKLIIFLSAIGAKSKQEGHMIFPEKLLDVSTNNYCIL